MKRSRIPKLLGKLPTPPAITRTSFKVIGQRSRSPRRLMLRSEGPRNFILGRPTQNHRWNTKICITVKRHDLQGQRPRSHGFELCECLFYIFTCVSYAEARLSYRLDVCSSVCPSDCLSVCHTLILCQNCPTCRHTVFTAW